MTLWGFGFTNALALGWLAAAAAPLIIHLWNRRRHREVRWAAMEYLLAAVRNNARRMRIEQWLLLLVRTLAIVFVVLAAARPYARLGAVAAVAGERTLKLLVIDGSYSMAYQAGGVTLFDRAKQLALQIVNDSRQGDGFSLLLMAAPPRVIVGDPAMEPRDFLAELQSLHLEHSGADLSATLAKAEDVCRQAARVGLTRSEIYFFTDLGRNTWSLRLRDSSVASEFEQRLERLAALSQMVVVDLSQDGAENVALAEFALAESPAVVGRETRLFGQARHFGRTAPGALRIELLVDGRRAAESGVELAAGAAAPFAFTHRFESAGDHRLEVRTSGDALGIDDHRYLAIPVREAISVLCVNGKPGPRLAGAADYVQLALDPQQDGRLSPVKVEVIPESALVERDLAKHDCIFLCNVGQLTRREARLLADFVRRGGGLAILLGDQVLPARYNQELADDPQTRLLPGRLLETATAPGPQWRIDPLGYRHPIVQEFAGHEDAGLLQVLIHKYFRLQLFADGAAQTALAVEGLDPLLVTDSFGRGRVAVLATDGSLSSFDTSAQMHWNRLAPSPCFPALVQETLRWALGTRDDDRNVRVGQPLGGALPAAAAHAALGVHTPLGPQSLHAELAPGDARWSFPDTSQAGFYRLDIGPESDRSRHFAVNVDATEGDLQKIDAADLPPQFSNRLQPSTTADVAALPRASGLERPLLYGAFGLLLLEMQLARRRSIVPQTKVGAL